VDRFHERLARIGLTAARRHGFALAGGYAVQAAGFLERPSADVGLFTAWERRGEFTMRSSLSWTPTATTVWPSTSIGITARSPG